MFNPNPSPNGDVYPGRDRLDPVGTHKPGVGGCVMVVGHEWVSDNHFDDTVGRWREILARCEGPRCPSHH